MTSNPIAHISPFFISMEIASFSAQAGGAAAVTESAAHSSAAHDSYALAVQRREEIDAGVSMPHPMIFAGESADGPNRATPPSGNGSAGGGDGRARPKIGWNHITSFRTPSHERLYSMRSVASAGDISNAIVVDLGGISGEVEQLHYLAEISHTFHEFIESGHDFRWKDLVGVVETIAGAADGLSPTITSERIGRLSGLRELGSVMRRTMAITDEIERSLLASGSADRESAQALANVYAVLAVKGACREANEESIRNDDANRMSQIYAAKAVLALEDVKGRFERLGNSGRAREISGIVDGFSKRHSIPSWSRRWALKVASGFLLGNIELIFAAADVDPSIRGLKREAEVDRIRIEREAIFLHNLRFIIEGNRQFAYSILLRCQSAFGRMQDREMQKRLREWATDESRFATALFGIG